MMPPSCWKVPTSQPVIILCGKDVVVLLEENDFPTDWHHQFYRYMCWAFDYSDGLRSIKQDMIRALADRGKPLSGSAPSSCIAGPTSLTRAVPALLSNKQMPTRARTIHFIPRQHVSGSSRFRATISPLVSS